MPSLGSNSRYPSEVHAECHLTCEQDNHSENLKNSLIMFGVILGIQDSYLKAISCHVEGKYERVLVCSTTSLSIYISFTKHVRFDPI